MLVLSSVAPDVRVEKEARFLSNEGHKVTVIGIDRLGTLPKEESRDGYTILRVPSKKKIFFKYFEYWKNVRKLVNDKQYDIIHFHDLNVLPLVSKLKNNGKIMIYDSHENFPEQMSETFGIIALWVYTWLERYYIKKVDGVITVSTGCAANLQRKYKVESAIVSNYPSKIDVDLAHKRDIPKDLARNQKFRVVHFGVMYSNLGYFQSVDAVEILKKEIKNSEIEFLVMGSGPAYEPMKKTIQDRGLDDYFKLTGWMDYQEALSILRTCDIGLILLQPGKNNFLRKPNRLYDYCSAGIPFIGSNFEGLQEGIEGFDEIGILIDSTSPQEIAKAILSVYTDRKSLEKMKKRAEEGYLSKFNFENEGEKVVKIYEEAFRRK